MCEITMIKYQLLLPQYMWVLLYNSSPIASLFSQLPSNLVTQVPPAVTLQLQCLIWILYLVILVMLLLPCLFFYPFANLNLCFFHSCLGIASITLKYVPLWIFLKNELCIFSILIFKVYVEFYIIMTGIKNMTHSLRTILIVVEIFKNRNGVWFYSFTLL